jgi:hypothetical protein
MEGAMDANELILGEDEEFVYLSEGVIPFLPKEMRAEVLAQKRAGSEVLALVDDDMKIVYRIANAFPAMASLRHIYNRLSSLQFEATTDWAFENEMLTSAFAITYMRLVEGGEGSGISKSALPAKLRPTHDYLKEVRNKRFAHHGGHPSLKVNLEIGYDGSRDEFSVNLAYQMGFHVGGATEWKELVEFLERIMADRLDTQLEKLREKTGRVWVFPTGPTPEWAKETAQEG